MRRGPKVLQEAILSRYARRYVCVEDRFEQFIRGRHFVVKFNCRGHSESHGLSLAGLSVKSSLTRLGKEEYHRRGRSNDLTAVDVPTNHD